MIFDVRAYPRRATSDLNSLVMSSLLFSFLIVIFLTATSFCFQMPRITLEKFPIPISFSNLISGYSRTGRPARDIGAITNERSDMLKCIFGRHTSICGPDIITRSASAFTTQNKEAGVGTHKGMVCVRGRLCSRNFPPANLFSGTCLQKPHVLQYYTFTFSADLFCS